MCLKTCLLSFALLAMFSRVFRLYSPDFSSSLSLSLSLAIHTLCPAFVVTSGLSTLVSDPKDP